MAILGLNLDLNNPRFEIKDFVFWMPQFKNYMATEDGQTMFENLYPIANDKIFYSVFGADWKYAMSLAIAHYSYMISQNSQTPAGATLPEIAGGGATTGMLTGMSIGGFSKSFDLAYTALNSEEAMFWNYSSYGSKLMALWKTKANLGVMTVVNGPVPSCAPQGGFNINSIFGRGDNPRDDWPRRRRQLTDDDWADIEEALE